MDQASGLKAKQLWCWNATKRGGHGSQNTSETFYSCWWMGCLHHDKVRALTLDFSCDNRRGCQKNYHDDVNCWNKPQIQHLNGITYIYIYRCSFTDWSFSQKVTGISFMSNPLIVCKIYSRSPLCFSQYLMMVCNLSRQDSDSIPALINLKHGSLGSAQL